MSPSVNGYTARCSACRPIKGHGPVNSDHSSGVYVILAQEFLVLPANICAILALT